MNINEILAGTVNEVSVDEQKTVLEQMKEKKIFDLSETERKNLINFLCETSETNLAIDYLFHVIDNEVSYPIDDEKVKLLFSDERMLKMKDLMMEQLQDDVFEEEDDVSEEEDDVE